MSKNNDFIRLSAYEITDEIRKEILDDASKPFSEIKLYVWDKRGPFHELEKHNVNEIQNHHPNKIKICLSAATQATFFVPYTQTMNYQDLWINKVQAEQYLENYSTDDKAKIKALQNEKGALSKELNTACQALYGFIMHSCAHKNGAAPNMSNAEIILYDVGVSVTSQTLDKFFEKGAKINGKVTNDTCK